MPELGQTIKYDNIYGEVHKMLDDNYYIIRFGMEISSPAWYKKLHINEFKPAQYKAEWEVV